jgi:positive regulator of sigma E activity
MEKLKALWAKFKLFITEKVVPFFQKVKAGWDKVVEVLTCSTFVYVFPLTVFALLAFLLQSFLMALVCVIWLVPVIYNVNEKE